MLAKAKTLCYTLYVIPKRTVQVQKQREKGTSIAYSLFTNDKI